MSPLDASVSSSGATAAAAASFSNGHGLDSSSISVCADSGSDWAIHTYSRKEGERKERGVSKP